MVCSMLQGIDDPGINSIDDALDAFCKSEVIQARAARFCETSHLIGTTRRPPASHRNLTLWFRRTTSLRRDRSPSR